MGSTPTTSTNVDKTYYITLCGSCQSGKGFFAVLRVKIPVGNTKLEAEGDTEAELETAVRVALRVSTSLQGASSKQTLASQESEKSLSHQTSLIKLATEASSKVPPPEYTPPNYGKLKNNRERLRAALVDLMMNFDKDEATANEIIRHLEATGGKFKSKSKNRGGSARQLFRTDELIEGTGTGFKATPELLLEYNPIVWGNKTTKLSGFEPDEQQPERAESEDINLRY